MLVLSQCRMADGIPSSGEGVFGMRRAAAIAGVRTFVAPLWKIADTTEQALMDGFYKEFSAGKGRSEALRAAQLALLNNPRTASFLQWAPVILSGDPAPFRTNCSPRRVGLPACPSARGAGVRCCTVSIVPAGDSTSAAPRHGKWGPTPIPLKNLSPGPRLGSGTDRFGLDKSGLLGLSIDRASTYASEILQRRSMLPAGTGSTRNDSGIAGRSRSRRRARQISKGARSPGASSDSKNALAEKGREFAARLWTNCRWLNRRSPNICAF